MKPLKYSATSKIKKQNQEEKDKISHSVLNTLKQDDQITSNLLDTLNEDYIQYLEDLMGKQTSSHHRISKPPVLNPSHFRQPSINEHLSQENIIKPTSLTLNRNLYPKRISLHPTIKPQKEQTVQSLQNRRKSKSVSINPNQIISFDCSKAKKKQNKLNSKPVNRRNDKQKVSEKHLDDKKDRRNNIYISPFQKYFDQADQQPLRRISKKSQLQAPDKEKLKNGHLVQESSQNQSNSVSSQIQERVESSISSQDEWKKVSYFKNLKQQANYYQSRSKKVDQFVTHKQKTRDSSLEQLLIKIITKYNKLLTKFNREKKKNQFLESKCGELKNQSQAKDRQIFTLKQLHKQLFQNTPQIIISSKTQNLKQKKPQKWQPSSQIEKFEKQEKNQNTNLQNLGLKNLYFLQKSRQPSTTKDKQRWKNFNILQNDKKITETEHTKKDLRKKQDFSDQNKNMKKTESMGEKQKRSVSWRQDSNKMINRQLKYVYTVNNDEKVNKKKMMNFSKTLQNQRQKNMYQFSATLPNQSDQKKDKIQYKGLNTNDQIRTKKDYADKISEVGQYSARKKKYEDDSEDQKQAKFTVNKWIHLLNNQKKSDIVSMMMERNRSYSEIYNALSFKRKSMNDMKYKFMKDNYKKQHQEPAKYYWKHKLNQRQNDSSSNSQSEKNIEQNLQYFAKSIRGSTSDNYFKNDPTFYHEQSQSTDSELLEKLLSIQKTSTSFASKNLKDKSFFR